VSRRTHPGTGRTPAAGAPGPTHVPLTLPKFPAIRQHDTNASSTTSLAGTLIRGRRVTILIVVALRRRLVPSISALTQTVITCRCCAPHADMRYCIKRVKQLGIPSFGNMATRRPLFQSFDTARNQIEREYIVLRRAGA